MGHAYTPGLRITKRTVFQKKRSLPIKGKILVKKDQHVDANEIVASAQLPGKIHNVNVVNALGITPDEIHEFMVKKEKDPVSKGEPVAMNKPLIRWFQTIVRSPVDGIIENISTITGQVLLREPPQKLELKAYIDGIVVEVLDEQGVIVETVGSLIQGIFGVGGEEIGNLCMVAKNPEDVLTADMIRPDHAGKIIIGGSYVTSDVWEKAKQIKVRGIVVGGVEAYDIKRLLGYELGVAITGMEDIGFALIVTEGFGRMPMAKRTFDLLGALDGKKASICGATQIRAGVMRPEIIVSQLETSQTLEQIKEMERGALAIGDMIRIIREPYFGRIGKVKSLPNELKIIETESKVRVLEVEFVDGSTAIIPRANIEILEEK